MAQFDFCGPTYQSLSPNFNAEWCINLYLENDESGAARSPKWLVPTDGLSVFAALPAVQSVAGIFTFAGRTFAVGSIAGNLYHLFEVTGLAAVVDLGALDIGGSAPAIWAANPTQVAFTVGGTGTVYILTLSSNAIAKETLSGGAASSVAFLDGFFVALLTGTNSFQVSALEDGTTWPSINQATISEFPDNAVSMIVSNRILAFLGQKSSVPYYNAGALFPFIPVPNVLIQEGSIATYGVSRLDNTILWLGGNVDEGQGIAFRQNGYTPARISNHALESIWQTYPTLSDCITYTYQTNGHKFWHLYFPTANASWRYDISTGQWHQVGTWNSLTNSFQAHKSSSHTMNFGQHLVGDPFSGNIYSLSVANTTDNGVNIRRVRRAPYIAREHEWMFHNWMEVLAESGLASQIKGASPYAGSINLLDSSNVLWTVTIADNGTISTTAAAAGQVASNPIVLADNVNQTTFWQLQISTGGTVSGLSVPRGNPQFAIFQMGTVPTLPNTLPEDTGLQVNQGGTVTSITPIAHLREPLLNLRWSDDGGHTWSNYHPVGIGLTGNYTKRAIWRRLGRSRNRVYEVSYDDPVSLRLVNAFVDADPEMKPQTRLMDKIRAQA